MTSPEQAERYTRHALKSLLKANRFRFLQIKEVIRQSAQAP
jgi:hypothetical protein